MSEPYFPPQKKSKAGPVIGAVVIVIVVVVAVIVIIIVLRRRAANKKVGPDCVADGGCPSGYCDVAAGKCLDCNETAPTISSHQVSVVDGFYVIDVVLTKTQDADTSTILILISSPLDQSPLAPLTCPEQSPYPIQTCSSTAGCNAGYVCANGICENAGCIQFPGTDTTIRLGGSAYKLYPGWGYSVAAKINYQCGEKTRVSDKSNPETINIPSCNVTPPPSAITIMDSDATGQPTPPDPSSPLRIAFTMSHSASVATGVSITFIGGAVAAGSNHPSHPNQYPWSYVFNGQLVTGGGSTTSYYGYIPRPPGSSSGQTVYGRLILKGGVGQCESNPSTVFRGALIGTG